LAIIFTFLCAVSPQAGFVYENQNFLVPALTTDATNILGSFAWLTSLLKNPNNFSISEPGSIVGWDGYLNFTNLTVNSTTFNTAGVTGNVTNSNVVISGLGINVVVTFNYTAQTARGNAFSGNGNITYVSKSFNLTKTDVLPATKTAVVAVDLSSTVINMDSQYTTDTYSKMLTTQMLANITLGFATGVYVDLQTAVNTYFAGQPWPHSIALETQLPDQKFTYNTTWTDAPVYANNATIYSLAGNTTATPPTPTESVKKMKGFLKAGEETVGAVPAFDPTLGSRQISISTQSLVYGIAQSLVSSGNFTFGVQKTLSHRFNVNTDYLARIYPGVLSVYPRDAAITVNAQVYELTLANMVSGTCVINFNVTDTTGKLLLEWDSTVNISPSWVVAGNTLNFMVQPSFLLTTVYQAPYGFVDTSTLDTWIDDAFFNYNTASWTLFKTPLDFTTVVGTVNATATVVNDTTIIIAGN